MYTLINQNLETLLNSINFQNDIKHYVWLLSSLPNVDVTKDLEFQRIYRRYWQLNPARLSEEYLTIYFRYLEQSKSQQKHSNVEVVSRYLLSIPTHSNNRHSLQFSFASKFVHMLNPEQPVLDSMVTSFFFLPTGGANETTEQKITRLLVSYEFLCTEYRRILELNLLAAAIERFRERFQLDSAYSDTKVIDTLVWKFVGLLRSGAVRDAVVVYG